MNIPAYSPTMYSCYITTDTENKNIEQNVEAE